MNLLLNAAVRTLSLLIIFKFKDFVRPLQMPLGNVYYKEICEHYQVIIIIE